MKLIAIVDGSLYSVHWESANEHSLDEMATTLSDVEWLRRYFAKRKKRLSYFNTSLMSAVKRTAKEAHILVDELREYADQNVAYDLDDLFAPLHKDSFYRHPRYFTDYKVSGKDAPWVRVYAVKMDNNLYAITGYGVKLVPKIQGDVYLEMELDKLERATTCLKEEGLLDI